MEKQQPLVRVDFSRCIHCDTCRRVCPNRVFTVRDDTVDIHNPGRCIQCGHCVAVCPEDALSHTQIGRDFTPVPPSPGISPDDLQDLFARRRSCRRFTDAPISEAELTALFVAASRAPTATNSQSVRFIVLDTPDGIDLLAKRSAAYYIKLAKRIENPVIRLFLQLTVGKRLVDNYRYHLPAIAEQFQAVVRGERSLFHHAPVVLVAISSGLPMIASANVNLAVMQMMLKAETLTLGTLFNGYALTAMQRDRRIRDALEIRRGYQPYAVLAVGHPAISFRKSPPRRMPRVIRPFS